MRVLLSTYGRAGRSNLWRRAKWKLHRPVTRIGSYNREARWLTLDLLLRAWEAARDDEARVELLD